MHLCIQYMITSSSLAWFPNSDIRGSRLICSSPRLFAACHVLRRLLMPRHSPYALFSLNFSLAWVSQIISFTMKKLFFAFCFIRLDSFESRLNCSFFTTISWKTFYLTLFLKSQNYLFVFSSLFSFQWPFCPRSSRCYGGLKWSRTTDLMLIRHAL